VTCPHGLLPWDVGCHPRTTFHSSDKCHAQLNHKGVFSKSTQPNMGRRSGAFPQINPTHPPGEKTRLRSTQPNTIEEKTRLRSTQLSPSGRRYREGTGRPSPLLWGEDLKNVSGSCNHQHSLSARGAFSVTPSLSRKYMNFDLARGLVRTYAICSSVGRYSTRTAFLCTISRI
jgi:hypothetical protein